MAGASLPPNWTPVSEASTDQKRNPGEGHSAPPSRVVHVRNVSDGTREHDLIGVVKSFGKVTYVTLMARQRQALIEFENGDSAISLVQYNKDHDIYLLGRPAFFNFSLSQSIKRAGQAGGQHQEYAPNKILLFTILNPMYPITANVLHSIAHRHGEVLRIAIFHKNGVQALVEFATVEQAVQAKDTLDNADIYAGCCTLKIEFSKADRVNVAVNNEESWDYTGQVRRPPLQPTPRGSLYGPPQPSVAQYNFDGYGNTVYPPGSHQPYTSYSGTEFMPSSVDSYRLGAGGLGMEPGAVLMVYNLESARMNCERIFNIFCAYGNILRIKVLLKKPGAAMVQMDRREGAMNAIKLLSQVELMGRPLQITFSHHSTIEDRGIVAQLADGSPAVVDYAHSRNNRFMSANQSRKNFMIQPTQVLHFFNTPPTTTAADLQRVFESAGVPQPLVMTVFDKKDSGSRTSGLLEWASASQALEVMAVVNHTPLHAPSGQVFTLKVAFSMSSPRSAGQFSPDEGSTSSPTVLTPRVSVAAATTTQAPVSVTITTAGSVSSGSSGSTGTMPSPRQDTDTDSGSQQKQQQVMPESILNGISNIQFSEQVSV